MRRAFEQDRDGTEPARVDSPLVPLISAAARMASNLGSDFTADADELLSLQERLVEERFHLAVLGHFKRGKSTLVNALLGANLLPTSVLPLTSVPTFLRAGERLSVTVSKQDGGKEEEFSGESSDAACQFLTRFITEEANPRNRLGVSLVEVRHPAPLLRQGVVLIDTPGIGSTYRHNTETTLNILPQCDAALFVVSADPPITEVEVEFLKTVCGKVGRLFFIFNKADYLSDGEREVAVKFLREVLREQAGIDADARIFCTSARQALEAKQTNDAALWTKSGAAEVEHHLTHFLTSEKAAVLVRAVARKAGDIVGGVLLRVDLMVRSLQMPLEELDERMRQFDRNLQQAERERLSAADMLEGDRKRMRAFLEEQAEELRQKARSHLEQIVDKACVENVVDEKAAQEKLAGAIPTFFARELVETTTVFRQRLLEIAKPHQQRADALIQSLRHAAAKIFDVPYRATTGGDAVVTSHDPYWVARQWNTSITPVRLGIADGLMPKQMRRARAKARLMEQVTALAIHNVENLRWSTLQNLDQTFLNFAAALDDGLQRTVAATRAAIQAARRRRDENAETVERRVSEFQPITTELRTIQDRMVACCVLTPNATFAL